MGVKLTYKISLHTSESNRIGFGVRELFPVPRAASNSVKRRFIRVHGRGVHFLRAGEGSPVVLLHSAILSARAELPLLRALATDHTVFAFDNPGFGDSDPLVKRDLQIADVAEALQATLAALKVPRCPVYGSHTGGAIAIEFALRYPDRVSGLVVNGINIFRGAEAKYLRSEDYRPEVVARDDGSHLFSDWVKSRDTMTWFPWNHRGVTNRLPWPAPSPETLHDYFLDRLRTGNGYRQIYGAVFKLDEPKAVAALKVPITIMAHAHDILFPHLDRLRTPRANQKIARYPADEVAYVNELSRIIRGYRVETKAPVAAPFRPTPGTINRRYIDLAGGQLLVRSAGEARSGRPLLLLHDGRASSRVFEPLMRALAPHRAVYAPDLPDNGSSDVLAVRRRTRIGDYAAAVIEMARALRLSSCDVYAVGAGAAVALELLVQPEFANARTVLEAPDFYPPAVARRLARSWVPSLAPSWDGAHLNQVWLMLRDEYAFWPWFDKSAAAACAVEAPSDWREMHARVVDILRSLPTYHRLTSAALQYDWGATLRRMRKRSIRLAAAAADPRRAHIEAAARRAHVPDLAILPTSTRSKAREILRLLRG
jgi:pimeloyl-ACP methyl ester carboxylesterase